jgi:hypothetical protein
MADFCIVLAARKLLLLPRVALEVGGTALRLESAGMASNGRPVSGVGRSLWSFWSMLVKDQS